MPDSTAAPITSFGRVNNAPPASSVLAPAGTFALVARSVSQIPNSFYDEATKQGAPKRALIRCAVADPSDPEAVYVDDDSGNEVSVTIYTGYYPDRELTPKMTLYRVIAAFMGYSEKLPDGIAPSPGDITGKAILGTIVHKDKAGEAGGKTAKVVDDSIEPWHAVEAPKMSTRKAAKAPF